jgi:CTP synthase
MLDRLEHPCDEVTIGLVGKYVEYEDSYKSLKEALLHGGLTHQVKVNINWVEAQGVTGDNWAAQLEGYDGILVPGGFGERGIEGMINAIRYARERRVPYFGICLGMQTMVIEFARNVCGLEGANSTEFNSGTPYRVIFKLRELKGIDELGGTMRLGAWPCKLAEDSFAYRAYGAREIRERHRHRYEFNREYEDQLKAARRRVRRDLRDPRPSLVPGLPVSPRIQIQTHGAAPAVQRVYRRGVPRAAAAPGAHRRGAGRVHPCRLSFPILRPAGRWS